MKGPVVTVQVGAENEEFVLHKDLLTSKCPAFFGAALLGEFSEAQSSTIKLPEDEPKAFQLFIDWIYCGTFPPIPFRKEWVRQSVHTMKKSGQLGAEGQYHRLYYMAEKWFMHSLANQAIDVIRNFHNGTKTTIHPEFVVMGYHNTCEKSPLRQYLMKSVAFAICQYPHTDQTKLDNEYLSGLRFESPSEEPDILRDVLKHYAQLGLLKGSDDPHEGDPWKYHAIPPRS